MAAAGIKLIYYNVKKLLDYYAHINLKNIANLIGEKYQQATSNVARWWQRPMKTTPITKVTKPALLNHERTSLHRHPPPKRSDANRNYSAYASLEKISFVEGLNEMMRAMAVSGLKERHPEATPQQIHRMLADLMLGPELAQKVYDHSGQPHLGLLICWNGH